MQSRSRLWNYRTLRNIIAWSCHALGWSFSWLTPNLGLTSHGWMVSSSPMRSWRWVCHSHPGYLRSLLQVPHFAAIRILSKYTHRYLDVLVLRKMQQDLSATPTTAPTVPVYPVLPSVCLQHLHLRWRNIEVHQQLLPYSALHADIIFRSFHLFSYEFSFINSVMFLIFHSISIFDIFRTKDNSVRWHAMSTWWFWANICQYSYEHPV